MAGDAKSLVKIGLVVVDDVDSRELSKDLHKDGEEDSLAVAGLVPEVFDAPDGNGVLESDLVAHLCEFGLEEGFVIALAMETFKHRVRFVVSLLLQKPARGEGKPVTTSQDQDGR